METVVINISAFITLTKQHECTKKKQHAYHIIMYVTLFSCLADLDGFTGFVFQGGFFCLLYNPNDASDHISLRIHIRGASASWNMEKAKGLWHLATIEIYESDSETKAV